MAKFPVSVYVWDGQLRIHTVNKCASHSITAATEGSGRTLSTPDEQGDEYRFMVVRHPLERIVSAWAYFCAGDDGTFDSQGRTFADMGYYYGMPFTEFLSVCCDRPQENDHTRKQVDFKGPHEIDEIVRLDKLGNQSGGHKWHNLRHRFPFLKDMVRSNRSTHRDWFRYFTHAQRRKAERVFHEDMELFANA